MKRVLLLLLFLPLLAVAQKDSIKTFKIGECTPVLAGKYRGSVKSTLSAFIANIKANPKLELVGCGDSAKIVSFDILYVAYNVKFVQPMIGAYFYSVLINEFQAKGVTFLVIKNIYYTMNGKKYYLDKKVVLDMAGQ